MELAAESLQGALQEFLGLGGTALVIIVLGLAVLLLVYFLPTIVATVRHKRNALAILLLNLFAGWSLIGWVVAIVWAASVDRERD